MSINIPTDTYNYTWHLPAVNRPTHLQEKLFQDLNDSGQIYEINLDTRTINGPKILSCQYDHNAEIIVFKIDRYHGTVDLADTCCIIQFTTIDEYGQTFVGLYPVEYYDVLTCQFENKILIPWSISRAVTQTATTIHYNLRFYHIGEVEKNGKIIQTVDFNLNTLPTQATILQSLPIEDDSVDSAYQEVENAFKQEIGQYSYERILDLIQKAEAHQILYWENASDLL